MRPLSAAELLDAWEQGLGQPLARRALTLLAAACPETDPEALAGASIGRRDADLLTLREWTFGPQLASVATCPGCAERLELTFDVADVRVDHASAPDGLIAIVVDDYGARVRLPNSLDTLAVGQIEEVGRARRVLLERCVAEAHHAGGPIAPGDLPPAVVERIVERMAQADPQADRYLALECPACRHTWQASFDIAAYLWHEIETWACRLLRDVHTLASAYGWRERDIIALSPRRRQVYLEMVGG